MRSFTNSASIAAMIVALPSMAFAADWDTRVGGFYNAMVAYATIDLAGACQDDFDGVDVTTSSEIFFQPAITLDNGIKIGSTIDLDKPPADPSPNNAVFRFGAGVGSLVLTTNPNPGWDCYEVGTDVVTDYINTGSGSIGTKTSNLQNKRADIAYM